MAKYMEVNTHTQIALCYSYIFPYQNDIPTEREVEKIDVVLAVGREMYPNIMLEFMSVDRSIVIWRLKIALALSC